MIRTCIAFFFLGIFFSLDAQETPPNILLILADDLGHGDLGVTGSTTIQTPHLDALASSGALFTQAYVTSPVCSPSRAGLITGRDPRRFGYESNLNRDAKYYPTRPEYLGLPKNEHTLADHLKAVGYHTALIGKWHLGKEPEHHPNRRGFEHFLGMLNGSHPYFPTPTKNHLEKNGEAIASFQPAYLTDFFTKEIINYWDSLRKSSNSNSPWFVYASYNAPHTPMQATEEDLALYQHIPNKKRRTYAAMVHALDRGIGHLIKNLNEHNELENTLIVFLSDNGGTPDNGSWNGDYRGHKGTLREGGLRVPFFISWPETIPEGITIGEPISALDLLPTFLAAAQAEALPLSDCPSHEDPNSRQKGRKRYGDYDGINLLPYLVSTPNSPYPERQFFWRLQGQTGILKGQEKLITLSHRAPQLYDLKADSKEEIDLSATESSTAAQLHELLGQWESSLPTVPLWGSEPKWAGHSAMLYDRTAQPEPFTEEK